MLTKLLCLLYYVKLIMVEPRRVELLTSCVQGRRSTN